MAEEQIIRTPEWLSVREIARQWSEETGGSIETLTRELGDWYEEFLVQNAYSGQDTEMAIEDRQVWRDTFAAYCDAKGIGRPKFWFSGDPESESAIAPPLAEAEPTPDPAEAPIIPEPEAIQAGGGRSRARIWLQGLLMGLGGLAVILLLAMGLLALWAFTDKELETPVEAQYPAQGRQVAAVETGSSDVSKAAAKPAEAPPPQAAAKPAEAKAPAASAEPTAAEESNAASPAETMLAEASSQFVPEPAAVLDKQGEELVFLVEQELWRAGYDPGQMDGRRGPRLSAALESYQRARGLEADGKVSQSLLYRLARENLDHNRADAGTAEAAALGGDLKYFLDLWKQAPGQTKLVRRIQTRLREMGFDPGPADGRLGPRTRVAIEDYERGYDLKRTGAPSAKLLRHLDYRYTERRAFKLYRAGDYRNAASAFAQIVRYAPQDPNVYFNRGLAYKNAGLGEKALADYAKAIRLDPGYFRAHLDRGNVLYRAGRYRAALRSYFSAIEVWFTGN
jgi:peptidoglycan hydrolase-like protein with peptidoglycan-binding domain